MTQQIHGRTTSFNRVVVAALAAAAVCLVAVASLRLVADEPSGTPSAPNGGYGEQPQPFQWDEEEPENPCGEWDGGGVYCDVIGGNVILLGTADGERVYIEDHVVSTGLDEGYLLVTILVTYSDDSWDYFTFSDTDMLYSAGYSSWEEVESAGEIFFPMLHIDMACGSDVVFNDCRLWAMVDLGAGHDRYRGGPGRDFVFGGSGTDVIFGGDREDELHGGLGSDILHGYLPDEDVFSWPGEFDKQAWLKNPHGVTIDGHPDLLDCGQDGDGDLIFPEAFENPNGVYINFDSVIHLDWFSPIGTDIVRQSR